jgi:hypothetical protein
MPAMNERTSGDSTMNERISGDSPMNSKKLWIAPVLHVILLSSAANVTGVTTTDGRGTFRS